MFKVKIEKIPEWCLIRSSRTEVFCKKGVLKYVSKFTGKQFCQSLFFNKIAGLRLVQFSALDWKIKKIHPEKNSLYLRKWNFLALILKKFLYFLKRKLFIYFWKWNPAFFSPSSKNKKIHPENISHTSGNGNLEKTYHIFSKENFSYISGNGNPKKFLIVQETETIKTFLYFRKQLSKTKK